MVAHHKLFGKLFAALQTRSLAARPYDFYGMFFKEVGNPLNQRIFRAYHYHVDVMSVDKLPDSLEVHGVQWYVCAV